MPYQVNSMHMRIQSKDDMVFLVLLTLCMVLLSFDLLIIWHIIMKLTIILHEL